MIRKVAFADIENVLDSYIVVDVRSPSEYAESTITGAHNIPLFSDMERACVGTVYVNEGKSAAVRLGVEYVSKSLPVIYKKFEELAGNSKKFIIFCSRGGMRSEAVAGFLSSIGFSVVKLEKGYKGYRQHIIKHLPLLIESAEFVTLYGKTGTGKTRILKELEKQGYSILDLEFCAGHRGSVFGGLGLKRHSQKQFETMVYDALKNAEPKLVFIEGESNRIGNIYLPNILMNKMTNGRKLLIEAAIQVRRNIIKGDYLNADFDKKEAITALQQLVNYISKTKITEYAKMIEQGVYDEVIDELMIKYYDITYHARHTEYEHTFINSNSTETATAIGKYIKK